MTDTTEQSENHKLIPDATTQSLLHRAALWATVVAAAATVVGAITAVAALVFT